ncbi:MAG: hypothetical protein Tsb0013_12080 [Phycisphaerales bacterium]
MTTTNDNGRPGRSGGSGHTVLWASAFVLMGMVLTQAGRVGVESEARADVSEVGDLTVATMTIADGSEPIAILSRRSERIFFYGVERGELILLATEDLPQAFTRARELAGNTGR